MGLTRSPSQFAQGSLSPAVQLSGCEDDHPPPVVKVSNLTFFGLPVKTGVSG